jgi:putative acetyltransferase
VEKLLTEGVEFFVMRIGGAAAGCGAVKFFADGYAELKRMYVLPRFRGRGPGRRMIRFPEEYSTRKGFRILRLETGILQKEAVGLYEAEGFYRIEPFGEYQPDPLSYFYEKWILTPPYPSPNQREDSTR